MEVTYRKIHPVVTEGNKGVDKATREASETLGDIEEEMKVSYKKFKLEIKKKNKNKGKYEQQEKHGRIEVKRKWWV